MKVFITGGSGFIGTNLVQYYIDMGDEVLSFDIKSPQNQSHNSVWVEGDILEYAHFLKTVKDFQPDYLIHLAARTDLLENKDLLNSYAENIKGVENTISISNNIKSLRRVLFASTRMVCDINHIPNDYDEYSPPNFYGLSKVIGEKIVKNSFLKKEWLIFRPTSIWGPWFDSPYIIFFRTIQNGIFFKIKKHNPKKSFGYVGNSIYQIHKLMLAEKDKVDNKTFYLCDYPPLILNNWAELINERIGKGKLKQIPMWLLKPVAKVGDSLLKLGWNRVPITSFRLENLITNMVYPTDELQQIVGDLPYSLSEGVKLTTKWMSTHTNRDKLAGKKLNK